MQQVAFPTRMAKLPGPKSACMVKRTLIMNINGCINDTIGLIFV